MLLPVVAGLSVIALAAEPAVRADPEVPRCFAAFDKLLASDVFSDYPAPIAAKASPPVAPLVDRGQAHRYRTVLREGAKLGPNFAGHYTIIEIGCGVAIVCPAIMDANTGRVFFPPELKNAEALLMDTSETNVEALNYRPNSRLLIIAGTPNENLKNEGMSYYVWRSDKLTRLRFTPKAKLCERD